MTRFSAALLITHVVFSCAAPDTRAQPDKLSVLIVDGIHNHDWEAATNAVRAILLSTGRFTVDVSTSPPRGFPQEAWSVWWPKFSDYDVVLVNFNGGHLDDGVRWPLQVERALEQYVRSGGGLVILHAANNAFLNWPAYNEMIGLGWRNRDFGPGIAIDADGNVVEIPKGAGLDPGHGPRHDFPVCLREPDHPITMGMPDCWLHPSEQLTHGQHGPADGLTILTYAYSEESGQNEPMDWIRHYEQGRVYTTMLGHTWRGEDNPNLECVGFQSILARGVEWAASGHVMIPLPADFPSPHEVVRRPLH